MIYSACTSAGMHLSFVLQCRIVADKMHSKLLNCDTPTRPATDADHKKLTDQMAELSVKMAEMLAKMETLVDAVERSNSRASELHLDLLAANRAAAHRRAAIARALE